ncbi:MAG TPA: FAD-dependent monooxygenase [Solirubrobacteraceae bacterium]|jgi:2-polyprenyl-6-methoxyphenol hydroxylase-like FAD-dependent oxidoreductase|nr:FAD-dependent monooxygenase [Solirubrobacteraceae bacterium]
MARIILLGGGVCGLAAGMLLARDGHEVTVLERDAAAVPESVEEAWENWSRDGVVQFRLAHFLAPGGRAVLEEDLPDVLRGLIAAGAARLDLLALVPPHLAEAGPRAEDARFVTYTARRPVFEQVLARAAAEEPGLEVRRGAAVKQLTVQVATGTPHVNGARLESGETLRADLVVDAMGRGSRLPRWLREANIGPLHEESEDSGFIYYGRYFRSRDGTTPQPFGPLLAPLGSFSVLTLPCDNGTWAVTLVTSSGDRVLKRMRDPDLWTAVVRACPAHAHWLDGEPISELEAMGGVLDRYRRLRAGGRPLVTGIALLGDAWACTNPSLGRGISLGLLHARALREVVRSHLDDPQEFAEAWDADTEARLTPWYRETVEEDRDRLREIDALRDGIEPAPPSERRAVLRDALGTAALYDPGLFRAYLDSRAVVRSLGQTFSEDGVAERALEVAGANERLQLPGPSRAELMALLA